MIDVGAFIQQAGKPHGTVRLGAGPRTIGQAGCLLACLTMAARALTGRMTLDMLDAHLLVDAADGFSGSSLIVPDAAAALGLAVVERGPFDALDVGEDMHRRRPVIIGVDYKIGRSSGQSEADHFLLAIEGVGDVLVCADPATGARVNLSLRNTIYRGFPASIVEMLRLRAVQEPTP